MGVLRPEALTTVFIQPLFCNATNALEARSNISLTPTGFLAVLLGLYFKSVDQFIYYACDFIVTDVDLDATWVSQGCVPRLVTVANVTAAANASWVPKVQVPLMRFSLTFDNTLTWYFPGVFKSQQNHSQRKAMLLDVASAFIQTLIFRAAESRDDLYNRITDRNVTVTWRLEYIKLAGWFKWLMGSLMVVGVISSQFLVVVAGCFRDANGKSKWQSPTF